MALENIISFEIPAEDLKAVQDALTSVETIFAPYLLALTADQRRRIPKMSDGSAPFVNKTMDYATEESKFAPPYLSVEEMRKDFNAVTHLTQILRRVDKLQSNLNDTLMLAGSESFVAALSYYNSVKMAARMNVPGAKPIYDDLSKRFTRTGRGNTAEVNAAD
jgi:hypothetical protein